MLFGIAAQFILNILSASLCYLVVESKVFNRCELAQVLHQRHDLDLMQTAQWVCIAQYSSGLDTKAITLQPNGSLHGLFQINDASWCSQSHRGCNLSCNKLRDDELSDDLSCLKRIYDEYERIFGDGYTAWDVYKDTCKNSAFSEIEDCFEIKFKPVRNYNYHQQPFSGIAKHSNLHKTAPKVYERCELAVELYKIHKMPMQQIPTWICIAEHESHFNTTAIRHLNNADGSSDYGLFQINDRYWCSHDSNSDGGKECGLACSKLMDTDITDDVQCIKKIYKEHTSLSGDGFTAWPVYKLHCQNRGYKQIENCFERSDIAAHQKQTPTKFSSNNYNRYLTANNNILRGGKVYTRCSLAQELYFEYNLSIRNIPTWVCIAEHESQFNTAALGLSNTDGSVDHGLFQINDRYWCDHSVYGGKGCNLPCEKLLDDDIKDDVACIKSIYNKHTTLTGNGFNAWNVYPRSCQNQNIDHIKMCFNKTTVTSWKTQIYHTILNKCEVANELYYKQKIHIKQIPQWICIAEHDSSLNISSIRHINLDALLVHNPHCYNIGINNIKECFTENVLNEINIISDSIATKSKELLYSPLRKTVSKGKTFERCELVQELLFKYLIPIDQVPTWVCIAKHESSFNTAAVGRLNADGSKDYGIFQISELYWCSNNHYGINDCNIPCEMLLDSDITDDIKCIKKIHEEHTQLSGDGFNAWSVYNPYCRNQNIDKITTCLSAEQIKDFERYSNSNHLPQRTNNVLSSLSPFLKRFNQQTQPSRDFQFNYQDEKLKKYANNPFLRNILDGENKVNKPQVVNKKLSENEKFKYANNPFLRIITRSGIKVNESQVVNNQFSESEKAIYANNTFLQITTHSGIKVNESQVVNKKLSENEKFKYANNPFLRNITHSGIRVNGSQVTNQKISKSEKVEYAKNPFLKNKIQR